MDKGHYIGFPFSDRTSHGVRVEGVPPWTLYPRHSSPRSLGHVRHAPAEDTIDANQGMISGLEEIYQTGLHSRAAGSREGEGKAILGAEEDAEILLHLVEEFEEGWIEMPNEWLGHGLEHIRMGIGRSGPEQEAYGQFRDFGHEREPSLLQPAFHWHGHRR